MGPEVTFVLQHLRCYSEYESPAAPIVTPLIRIDMWYPKYMGRYGSIRLMKERLATQISKLQAAPEGERAIMLWWLLTHETYVAKGADPMAVYETGKVQTTRSLQMLKPLADELDRLGLPIDLIFIDNEGGFGFYDMGQRWIRKILRSARARAKMPLAARSVNPDDFVHTSPRFVQALKAWDPYAAKLKYDALRRVVIQSGYFDVRLPGTNTIAKPSSVNFWSMNPTFRIRDFNGWELDNSTSLDGRSSGPQCYLGMNGSAYAGYQHHWLWNEFITYLNHVRSCLGRANSVVHPVVPHPKRCHPWIQEEMMAHMVRNGINYTTNRCAFLYWNAYDRAENDVIMADVLQRHDLFYPLQRNLPEIPFDVDQVTTADYTTTYADFLTNVGSVIPG